MLFYYFEYIHIQLCYLRKEIPTTNKVLYINIFLINDDSRDYKCGGGGGRR